jgi:hypothetical protein
VRIGWAADLHAALDQCDAELIRFGEAMGDEVAVTLLENVEAEVGMRQEDRV